jgi:hypothetical protein
MQKRIITLAAIAALSSAAAVQGAVTVDENGEGFIGKGAVQQAFDWNNTDLQANAPKVRFRFASPETVAWSCERTTRSGKELMKAYEGTQELAAEILADARRNRAGQVTGFILKGTVGAADYTTIGRCPTGWSLSESLISYEGVDEPGVQISVDDGRWIDLQMAL